MAEHMASKRRNEVASGMHNISKASDSHSHVDTALCDMSYLEGHTVYQVHHPLEARLKPLALHLSPQNLNQ